MITSGELRKIRRKKVRPKYAKDDVLIAAAREAGGDIYATIQNPATHQVYQYLTELIVEVLKKQTGRNPKEINVLDWEAARVTPIIYY